MSAGGSVSFLTPWEVAAFTDHPDHPGSGAQLESTGISADEAHQFRRYCRKQGRNWPELVNQALNLGANDPESFTRAVDHLTNQSQETTL